MQDFMILLGSAVADTNVSLDTMTSVISSLGFPIFVAVWLLWKSHKDTQVIQDSINKLENAIVELNTYVRALNKGGDK